MPTSIRSIHANCKIIKKTATIDKIRKPQKTQFAKTKTWSPKKKRRKEG